MTRFTIHAYIAVVSVVESCNAVFLYKHIKASKLNCGRLNIIGRERANRALIGCDTRWNATRWQALASLLTPLRGPDPCFLSLQTAKSTWPLGGSSYCEHWWIDFFTWSFVMLLVLDVQRHEGDKILFPRACGALALLPSTQISSPT